MGRSSVSSRARAGLSFPFSACGTPPPRAEKTSRFLPLPPNTHAPGSAAGNPPAAATPALPRSPPRPARRMRSAPRAAAPRGFTGRPHSVPPYLGRRARSRRAGGRAAAGRSSTGRRPARPASGPWRAGAAAPALQECPARAQVASCPPPARPGLGPWREGAPGTCEFLKRHA